MNHKSMNKYIISPITTYNEDEELFETKIGYDTEGMPLLYTVYGKTEEISRFKAIALVDVLLFTVHQVI